MKCWACLLALALVIVSVTDVTGQFLGKHCTYWAERPSQPLRPCFSGFTYNGKKIYNCTTEDYHVDWCSYGETYPFNGGFLEWGLCEATCRSDYCQIKVDSTKGRGKRMCRFPFKYNNVDYSDCTTIDDKDGKPWCAFEAKWNDGDDWGHCQLAGKCGGQSPADPKCRKGNGDVMTKSTGPGKHDETCHFPFSVDGTSYTDCTCYGYFKPWCALTPNFDTDPKWGVCKCVDANGNKQDLNC